MDPMRPGNDAGRLGSGRPFWFEGLGDAHQGRQQNPLGGGVDIFEWHAAYESCQRYFLNHAQHDPTVRAVAALVNIYLPFQQPLNPVSSFQADSYRNTTDGNSTNFEPFSRSSFAHATGQQRTVATHCVSLVPYIRRLVVTAFDQEAVLHGFFGDDWSRGVGPLQECERRNYMFAAKSGGWAKVKTQYDMGPQETVPFLQPPQNVSLAEIENAERLWSQWLATEDWMIGPRAPESSQQHARGTGNASQSSA